MKRTSILTLCAGALAFGLAPAPAQEHHGGGHGEADAASLFQTACASCHYAPDPAVDTDRSWIRQVQETA